MPDRPLSRRRPACGNELEHGPHEYDEDYWPDGSVLGVRKQPGHCAGWTASEADVCAMLRDVHGVMLEKAPPQGGRVFRLEVSPAGYAALLALWLPSEPGGRLERVHGAVVAVMPGIGVGRWQLAEVLPPLASGMIRL